MLKYLLLIISTTQLILFSNGLETCDSEYNKYTSKCNENKFKNKLEYNKFYIEKEFKEQRQKLFMEENELQIHIETNESKILDKYFKDKNDAEILDTCIEYERFLYRYSRYYNKINMIDFLGEFILYYKETEYELDMINYSYSNKIIKNTSRVFQLNQDLTQISNIIQHFLNKSDIKINNKIKSNLELIKLIGDRRIENCSNVLQCFLNASDIKINNKINHNLEIIKKMNTIFIKNSGNDDLTLNKYYKNIVSDTNTFNYCDHIYNISDILNLNDNNIQNDRKRLKYWIFDIIESLWCIGILLSVTVIPFIIITKLASKIA